MRTMHHLPTVYEVEKTTEKVPPNQGTIQSQRDSRKEKLIEAGIHLGTLFDHGMARVNLARARAGSATPIRRQHEQGARYFSAPAPHGGERRLALFIALPLHDGDIFGGAYIRLSCAKSAICVIPSIDAETPRWLAQASGTELTIAVIDDLFQATFSDDVDATRRLAPLYGVDLFATPWS
jgi:hypothetical protein